MRRFRTAYLDGAEERASLVCHPTEKRKFSIAELRRICGFPDDFALTGTFEQQRLSANDVCRLENMNPIQGGDQYENPDITSNAAESGRDRTL